MTKKILLAISCLLGLQIPGSAQVKNLDRIVGRVGNSIILKSDVDLLHDQHVRNDESKKNTTKCDVFYEIMMQQLLVAQAERDSVVVSEQEVDGRVEERLSYMLNRVGSKEELERQAGKSIYQIKEDNKKFIKDEMTARQMQQQIVANVKVTPYEVEQFYKSIPQDSLPAIPASITVGQLVFNPKPAAEMEEYAREKLEGIRKDIVEGKKSFSLMAGIYGMDGTKNDGGNLLLEKDKMDPLFVTAAMRLQPGEISPVFRGKFGYHIIQMIQKTSNTTAKVKHIIIIPEVTSVEFAITKALADSVYQLLQSGKMNFATAFTTYSKDDNLKMSGGFLSNPYTGSTNLAMTDVDAYIVKNIDKIPVGGYSEPHNYIDQFEQKTVRILYIKEKIEPHIFNLKDDYSLIQNQALMMKQSEFLKKKVNTEVRNYFISVDKEYQDCEQIKPWISSSNK